MVDKYINFGAGDMKEMLNLIQFITRHQKYPRKRMRIKHNLSQSQNQSMILIQILIQITLGHWCKHAILLHCLSVNNSAAWSCVESIVHTSISSEDG